MSDIFNKKLAIILMILAIMNLPEVSATDFTHPNIFLDQTEINTIKARINQEPWKTAYDNMMINVSLALNAPVQSVTFGGPIPPSDDIHDYWTDMAYSSDGVFNPNADRSDYYAAIKLRDSVRDLGLAYALTGEKKYADKAIQFIRAWTIDPSTKMNPKFVSGTDAHGLASKIELSITIPGMLYGADLIWNYPDFSSSDKEALKLWTRDFVADAKTWSWYNNLEAWRLVFISAGSVITEDSANLNYAFDRWKTDLSVQMDSQGKMTNELSRTRSFTYSLYAINAFMQTAEIAKHQGVDLYHYNAPNGRSLELALDFYAPYAAGKNSWPYQEIRWDLVDYSVWELAYSFKQKTSYKDVIIKRGRPMYELRNMGHVTLTHGNDFTITPTIIPTIVPTITPTITTITPTITSTTTPTVESNIKVYCYKKSKK